jgi:hypothetical protein
MKSRVKSKSRGKRKSGTAARTRRPAGGKSLKPKVSAKSPRKAAPKTDPLDSWIVAGVQGLGLKVEKSWMAAVRTNLRVTLDQGVMVAQYPLADDAEPAPVFRA